MVGKYLKIGILLILLVVVGLFLLSMREEDGKHVTQQKAEPANTEFVPYTAEFEIYTLGTKRIFTNTMYHNLSPDSYITSRDPSIVHVDKEGVTWKEFFDTLPFSLDKNCLVTGTKQIFCTGESGSLNFELNGAEDNNALDRVIGRGDTLIVRYVGK